MNFTKKNTNGIKGIAITIMMFHHCFLPNRYDGYDIHFFPFTEDFTIWMATFFKICVGMFAFLTGYGITISLKKKSESFSFSKNEIVKSTASRYISLMSGFLFIFVICQIFSWFMDKQQLALYHADTKITSLGYVILDALGLAKMFGTPTLNNTWWYMSFAIMIILIFPLLLAGYRKFGMIIMSVAVIIATHVLDVEILDLVRWICIVIFGIYFADKDLLFRLKEFRMIKEKPILNKLLKFLISTAILVFLVYARGKADNLFFVFKDCIIPTFVIYYCYEFILSIKYVNEVFVFLGKHSMNIFLTHTLIRYTYFESFTYSFKYPVVIVLILLAVSLAVSIVIEFIKKITRYNRLTDLVKSKVSHLIDQVIPLSKDQTSSSC